NRDLNALFWEIYQDALMVRPQRDLSPWAVHFELLSDPASQFCELLAAMISAQTRSHARREFDAVVDNPDFGTFLKRAYYAPGSWSSWSDLLLEGVGEQFEPRYYLNSIRSLHRPSPN
ncbi:MAG: hypothetical protein ACE5GA_10360, partial [Candidatus Zixiibacteriota bacterium]